MDSVLKMVADFIHANVEERGAVGVVGVVAVIAQHPTRVADLGTAGRPPRLELSPIADQRVDVELIGVAVPGSGRVRQGVAPRDGDVVDTTADRLAVDGAPHVVRSSPGVGCVIFVEVAASLQQGAAVRTGRVRAGRAVMQAAVAAGHAAVIVVVGHPAELAGLFRVQRQVEAVPRQRRRQAAMGLRDRGEPTNQRTAHHRAAGCGRCLRAGRAGRYRGRTPPPPFSL